MLCRLLLMRHGKSSSPPNVLDHERPLDEKGSNDASLMAQKIKRLGFLVPLVLCSDAKRTLQTWEAMANHFDQATLIKESAALYNANVSAYLLEIVRQDFRGHTLLVIGHNPTLEELVLRLTNEMIEMKPADLAVLEVRADTFENATSLQGLWKLVSHHSC